MHAAEPGHPTRLISHPAVLEQRMPANLQTCGRTQPRSAVAKLTTIDVRKINTFSYIPLRFAGYFLLGYS